MTSFGEDDRIIPALQAGAQGYLLKDIRPEELVKAVREANQGKPQLHPDVAQKMMTMLTKQNGRNQVSKIQANQTFRECSLISDKRSQR